MPWQRHQLVRLSHRGWQSALTSCADTLDAEALSEWARKDWPVIVRRARPDEPTGIPLGAPLPPAKGKRRLAFTASPSEVDDTPTLPSLRDVSVTAPAAWLPSLRALEDLADRYAINARVYGSLAWQHLTGETYLSSTSDLDIAWPFPARQHLASFLDDLASVEAFSPMRIDGELLRADGAGVQWRELWLGHKEVAVKTFDAVELQASARFLGAVS